MSFNPLIDRLPEAAEINGRKYPVNFDFRHAVAYLRLLTGNDTEEDKAAFGLSLMFGQMIAADDVEGLVEYLRWFLARGEEKRDDDGRPREAPAFDLLVDSGRVYAAFLQVYGINLRAVKIHWWTFLELLECLPQGTRLAEVIEIRTKRFEKWMKPGDRSALQALKDRYRIGERVDPITGVFESLRSVIR